MELLHDLFVKKFDISPAFVFGSGEFMVWGIGESVGVATGSYVKGVLSKVEYSESRAGFICWPCSP